MKKQPSSIWTQRPEIDAYMAQVFQTSFHHQRRNNEYGANRSHGPGGRRLQGFLIFAPGHRVPKRPFPALQLPPASKQHAVPSHCCYYVHSQHSGPGFTRHYCRILATRIHTPLINAMLCTSVPLSINNSSGSDFI